MDSTYSLNGAYKPTTKRFADIDGPDFYPTPAWATYALIDNEKFTGTIWECACGNGSMSEILKLTGNSVLSSDFMIAVLEKSDLTFCRRAEGQPTSSQTHRTIAPKDSSRPL